LAPAAAGTQSIQIVKSLPQDILPGLQNGELGILEAYQRAIANAQDFIYLENQYFSGRAIVQALIRALNTNVNLKIILLINETPDIPTYRAWQNYRLKQIGVPHPRVGIFTLWNTGFAAGKVSLQGCYIHSKVAIIDDKWATVGTANLDGISLEQATEFTLGGVGPGRHRRSIEINSVLFDGISNQPNTGNVSAIRRALWSEHLGRTIPNNPPAGGWLTMWTSVANANIASLNGNSPSMNGYILPYSKEPSDQAQLTSIGINTSRIQILD
jgi:hypothetical protein